MNLLKSKLSVAIAIGILGGSTQAFACVVSPDSILTEGQTLQLVADCTGDGTVKVQTINWQMAVGAGDPVSITGDVVLAQPKPKKIYLTTPIGLTSAGTGEYTFSVTGKYVGVGADAATNGALISTGESAKVVVKPGSVAVAQALGAASVNKEPAKCAAAVNGKVLPGIPTSTQQCDSGKGALAISGPSYFTWSCLSLTGGAEDNCYATREGYTATTTGTNTNTGTAYTGTPDDPGIGKGLWVPAGYPNLFVVDQSGTGITTTYLPGCLNGTVPGSSSWVGCSANDSFSVGGTTIKIVAGNVLSVRYKSKSTAGIAKKQITLSGFDGGPTGPVSVWLTDDPRKTYEATADMCKSYSTTTPGVSTGVYKTMTYCPISPDKTYYLNLKTTSTAPMKLKIFEDSSDMLP